jgi:hypothetical protein
MSAQLRQGTLSFHSSGVPQVNRPRPRPKALTTLPLALVFGVRQQRLVRGINEQEVTESFREGCVLQAVGLPSSDNDDSSSDDQP